MLNSGIYISFNIDSFNLLLLSLQITFFKCSFRVACSLKYWEFYFQLKPWLLKAKAGPLSISFVNENRLVEHVNRILDENEEELYLGP